MNGRKKVDARWRRSDWRLRPLEHFQVRYAATGAVAIRRLFMEFAEVIYREESMAEMEEKIERLEKAKEEEWGGPDRKRFGNLFYYSLVREPEMARWIEEYVKKCGDCAFWSVCLRVGINGRIKWLGPFSILTLLSNPLFSIRSVSYL